MPPSHVPSCRIPTPPAACRGSLVRAVEPGLAREQVLIGAASPTNHGSHVDGSCLACRQLAGPPPWWSSQELDDGQGGQQGQGQPEYHLAGRPAPEDQGQRGQGDGAD